MFWCLFRWIIYLRTKLIKRGMNTIFDVIAILLTRQMLFYFVFTSTFVHPADFQWAFAFTNTAKRNEWWLAKRKHVTAGWDQEHVGDHPPRAGRLTWQTKKMNWPALVTCRLFFTVTTVGSLWTQRRPQKWQELAPNIVIVLLRWVKWKG